MAEEIAGVMEELTGRRVDVAEVYSPPRVTAEAARFGLHPGMALDLTTFDENGEPWDFSKAGRRKEARRRLAEEDP